MYGQIIKYRKISHQGKPGQATVEFAMVLSLLVLLLIGVADVARIFSEHLSAVHAAGVGARWLILDPDNRSCSSLDDLTEVVITDLNQAISAANVVSITSAFGSNPATVRVDITYRHEYLFGLLRELPGTFSGGATMPGTHDPGPGVCPTPPVPLPTNTPISVPTITPIPTSTPPIVPPTNTTGPSPTPTCVPHGFTAVSGCRESGNGNRPWQVAVHVVGYGSGDLVNVRLCNTSNGNCGSANQMTCTPIGDCTYSSTNAGANETRVEFSVVPRPGSCVVAPLTFDLAVCGGATSTPTTVVSTATPTSTATTAATNTATRTATSTTVPPTRTNTATPVPPTPTHTRTFTATPVPPTPTRTFTATPVPPTATNTRTATSTPTPCTTNLTVSIVDAIQRSQGSNPSVIFLDVLVLDPCNGNAPVTNATVNALIGTTPILNISLAHSSATNGHYWACTSEQPVSPYNVSITASIPSGRTGSANGVTGTQNGNLNCRAP